MINLTHEQALFVYWMLKAGLERHQKFLRHDGWKLGLTKKEQHESQTSDRAFIKAIKLMERKLSKAEKGRVRREQT